MRMEFGSYELDIGAPGYQTTRRSVQVRGTDPECGCRIYETQRLDVALVPAS
jgi:hypothetical protein